MSSSPAMTTCRRIAMRDRRAVRFRRAEDTGRPDLLTMAEKSGLAQLCNC
ncbi:hypothetical protein [Streptomyces sp. NPDC005303]